MDPDHVRKLGTKFVGGRLAWEAFAEELDPAKKRQALDKIVRDNQAFIEHTVSQMLSKGLSSPMSACLDLDRNDLIQAGRRGYVRALERFDPAKGALPPFARTWIRKEVRRTAATDATIHKPEQIGLPAAALRRDEAVMAKHGRHATAEEMGITEKQYLAWKSQPYVVPLFGGHTPGTDKHDWSYIDHVATEQPNPEEQYLTNELATLQANLLPMEREVIRRLFWADETPEQVSKALSLDLDEVDAIKEEALRSLRENLK